MAPEPLGVEMMTVYDTTVLSQRYGHAADFSDAVDRAYLGLRKERDGHKKSEREYESVVGLAPLLEALLALLQEPRAGDVACAVLIPDRVIARLRSDQQLSDRLVPRLRQLASDLKAPERTIDDAELEALDRLAQVADVEASLAFRRLMRH